MNPIVCGNCQTENPGDADFCQECGQPLTQSAESGIVEQEAAIQRVSLSDGPATTTPQSDHVPGTDTTVRDGLPTD